MSLAGLMTRVTLVARETLVQGLLASALRNRGEKTRGRARSARRLCQVIDGNPNRDPENRDDEKEDPGPSSA
jgi:hypothetical protein